MQVGARLVSQPPTPTGRALAANLASLRPLSAGVDSQRHIRKCTILSPKRDQNWLWGRRNIRNCSRSSNCSYRKSGKAVRNFGREARAILMHPTDPFFSPGEGKAQLSKIAQTTVHLLDRRPFIVYLNSVFWFSPNAVAGHHSV